MPHLMTHLHLSLSLPLPLLAVAITRVASRRGFRVSFLSECDGRLPPCVAGDPGKAMLLHG